MWKVIEIRWNIRNSKILNEMDIFRKIESRHFILKYKPKNMLSAYTIKNKVLVVIFWEQYLTRTWFEGDECNIIFNFKTFQRATQDIMTGHESDILKLAIHS